MSFGGHCVTSARLQNLYCSRPASCAQDGTLITFAGRSLQEACGHRAYAFCC